MDVLLVRAANPSPYTLDGTNTWIVGRVESARLSRGRARSVQRTSLRVDSLSSFGEDAQGRVYVMSLNGPVYRIVPRG